MGPAPMIATVLSPPISAAQRSLTTVPGPGRAAGLHPLRWRGGVVAWWRGGVVVVAALDRLGRSLSGVIRGGGADRGRGAAALVAGGDRLLDAHRADARRDLGLTGGLRAGAADFTEAGDDADRVLTVCEDVIVSHEVDATTLDGRQLARAAAAPAAGYVFFASLHLLLASTTAPARQGDPR